MSNRPTISRDPSGLIEIVNFEQNCLGYAVGLPFKIYPSHGESLADLFGKLGYTCWPVPSSAACQCKNKNDKKVVFTPTKWKEGGPADPLNDPYPYIQNAD